MSVANQEDTDGAITVDTNPGELVTVTPEAEGADDDAAPALQTPEQAQNRKERRANRMREEKEARETAQREARELREALDQTRRETAELRGRMLEREQARDAGDPRAALTAELDRLETEAQEHLARSALASKAGDTAMAARELKAFNAKNREAAKLDLRAELEPEIERRVSEVRGQIVPPQYHIIRDSISREFPWVHTDKEAVRFAESIRQGLVDSGRPADDPATYREACALAAKRLGLGGRQAPTAESQRRMQAVPLGEGGGGGDVPFTLKMDQANKKLAHAMFKELDPKDAEKAFVNYMAGAHKRGEL